MGTLAKPIKVPDSGRAKHLHVVAGACSIQGARRDTNEDSQYISPDMDWFIVADGMGGHAAGEVASQFAVDVLSHELAKIAADSTPAEVEHRVHSALDRTHCVILDSQAVDSESRSPVTTDVVDEARLLKIITENDNPQVAVELLTQDAVSNDAGDDVTCVVFYIQSDFRHAASASPGLTLWERIRSLIKPK